MKVLITGPSLDANKNVSGISSVVQNIFATSDVEFEHFTVGKTDAQKRNFYWILEQILLPLKLMIIIWKYRVSILHLNAPLDILAMVRDFVLLLTAKVFRIKVVLHLHGGKYIQYKSKGSFLFRFLSIYFRLADHIIVLSEIEQNWLINVFELQSQIVTTLENCVLNPASFTRKINDKTRIIFLGRIVKRKGIYNISEALASLSKSRSDFEFYLYGTGEEQEEIINIISKKLTKDFYYKGIVSGNNKILALRQADIFLLPSLYGEGLPMGLLEAMSFGVIPIVTDDGSMKAVIQDEKNGFFVNKNDSIDLAKTIEIVLDIYKSNCDDVLRQNAKQTILEKFDCKNYSKHLERIYYNL